MILRSTPDTFVPLQPPCLGVARGSWPPFAGLSGGLAVVAVAGCPPALMPLPESEEPGPALTGKRSLGSRRTERLTCWAPAVEEFLPVTLDDSGSLSRRWGSSPNSTWRDVKTEEIVGWEAEGDCAPQTNKLGEDGVDGCAVSTTAAGTPGD